MLISELQNRIYQNRNIPKQYQTMTSSVTRIKFIKTKFIFNYHTKRVHKGAIRILQIGAGFKDYKLGQEGLQIGAA